MRVFSLYHKAGYSKNLCQTCIKTSFQSSLICNEASKCDKCGYTVERKIKAK